ncbi:DUF1127 domain-containing protein [Pseudomonas sp.]|uniref:DUF1127 domain-containing protein n=1 Tax=Pseudomonas sp. TaxID=306 RepID=UPI0035657C2A
MKGQKGYAIASVWPRQAVSLGTLAKAVWHQFKRWHELARQRRQLASLGDAALKDIGLSRADALQEVERPFWDDPLAK